MECSKAAAIRQELPMAACDLCWDTMGGWPSAPTAA
ncbi:hypothetical protein BJ987_002553 [Nocardia goodfellowii]|uniref:Uncharacterized protein n=1 Tax=Nocardia goodfellowii TaxID=882446 RepID=A0ABS4QD88_9NOCA|nr:hypothetical protein [Nocardia goodfellowii]